MMKLNIQVGIAAMSFAAGSFGASIFGMNLHSTLENHPTAFYIVSGTLIAGSIFTYACMLFFYIFILFYLIILLLLYYF